MVHRIQNRNPGYSDFNNVKTNIHYDQNLNNPVTSGANALKIESTEVKDSEKELISSMVDENMVLNNQIVETSDPANDQSSLSSDDTLILQTENHKDIDNDLDKSNGLENFDLSTQTPNLFNNDHKINLTNEHSELDNKDQDEEDELEIPAFLRRQKN